MTLLDQITQSLEDRSVEPGAFQVTGSGALPSWFDVTGLATASIGAVGVQLARLAQPTAVGPVTVDQRLASLWFGMTLRPTGWAVGAQWDPVAGDYLAADGWIRLHTNAPHHRAAALKVLGAAADRAAVEAAVAGWDMNALEAAVVEAGGCAAAMRSLQDWRAHPQGAAVAAEPLIGWTSHPAAAPPSWTPRPERPLAGLRVLDLTRVLAGPVASRCLAAFGAQVLRIDPPDWDEPSVVPEVTVGKRCAGLDLRAGPDREIFEALLAHADVLLHGYRPGALAGLGYDPGALRRLNPGLIDVSLCAYGWSGPWAGRRGFDSLMQMSTGVADEGMRRSGSDRPTPLPVQALDHATGYLMAAAAVRGLRRRRETGEGVGARLSLARTAALLIPSLADHLPADRVTETMDDLAEELEVTDWGPARRLRFPLVAGAARAHWTRPATALRSAAAHWLGTEAG